MCLDTDSLPPLGGGGGGRIRIAYLLLPWRTPCPEQLGSPGVSFSGANPHWMTLHRCVWEAEGKRAWSSLDGEESTSTHMWSSCFYIFRTDACTWSKVPHSSRTDFLLYFWVSPTISPPQFFKTRHWKIEKIHRVNWDNSGRSCFFFLKGSELPWLSKHWSSPTGNRTLPRAYSKSTRSRDRRRALWNFSQHPPCEVVQHMFFLWKLSVTLLGSNDSLRLSGEIVINFPKDQRLQKCPTDVPKKKNGQNRETCLKREVQKPFLKW